MFADLHCHLDGSLRPETLKELAADRGIQLPEKIGFYAGMGLQEALSRFALTLSVLQTPEAVRRVASELCEDARLNHVTTLEIRFAPQLHQGAPLEAILEAALEGISGRAGLILCGLYGEDPAVLERLVAVGRQYSGVVGLDLAGGPLKTHSWKMEDYARAFQKAGEAGLGRTVHAGEGRPPEEIRTAILKLGADRIGHGTTLMDDKRVLELVLKSKVTIEACLTSNVHTGAIPRLEAHPLPRWLKAGVRVCVCSDNTLLSNTNVRLELGEALKIPGMTAQLLAHTIAFGHQGCFSS